MKFLLTLFIGLLFQTVAFAQDSTGKKNYDQKAIQEYGINFLVNCEMRTIKGIKPMLQQDAGAKIECKAFSKQYTTGKIVALGALRFVLRLLL